MELNQYIAEAKHSTMLYMKFVGPSDSWPMLVKWPDVVDALVAEDKDALERDLSVLICVPLQSIISGLATKVEDKDKVEKKLADIISQSRFDVLKAKSKLIGLCNEQINKLRAKGEPLPLFEELKR